jgi:hypothetical protein
MNGLNESSILESDEWNSCRRNFRNAGSSAYSLLAKRRVISESSQRGKDSLFGMARKAASATALQ